MATAKIQDDDGQKTNWWQPKTKIAKTKTANSMIGNCYPELWDATLWCLTHTLIIICLHHTHSPVQLDSQGPNSSHFSQPKWHEAKSLDTSRLLFTQYSMCGNDKIHSPHQSHLLEPRREREAEWPKLSPKSSPINGLLYRWQTRAPSSDLHCSLLINLSAQGSETLLVTRGQRGKGGLFDWTTYRRPSSMNSPSYRWRISHQPQIATNQLVIRHFLVCCDAELLLSVCVCSNLTVRCVWERSPPVVGGGGEAREMRGSCAANNFPYTHSIHWPHRYRLLTRPNRAGLKRSTISTYPYAPLLKCWD